MTNTFSEPTQVVWNYLFDSWESTIIEEGFADGCRDLDSPYIALRQYLRDKRGIDRTPCGFGTTARCNHNSDDSCPGVSLFSGALDIQALNDGLIHDFDTTSYR